MEQLIERTFIRKPVLDNALFRRTPLQGNCSSRSEACCSSRAEDALSSTNTGMTFADVTFRKRDTEGALLIGTAINRMNLRPFRAEFCSDPIFPLAHQRTRDTARSH